MGGCGTGPIRYSASTDAFHFSQRNFSQSGSSSIKCVVVGDDGIGKADMVSRYANDTLQSTSTGGASTSLNVVIDEQPLKLLLEVPTGVHFDELRPLTYDNPKVDVVLVCFAIDNRESFENVYSRWMSELKSRIPNHYQPTLLVGLRSELRNAPEPKLMAKLIRATTLGSTLGADVCQLIADYAALGKLTSVEEGKVLATMFRSHRVFLKVTYVECSALSKDSVNDVFDKAMRLAIKKPPPRSRLESTWWGRTVRWVFTWT